MSTKSGQRDFSQPKSNTGFQPLSSASRAPTKEYDRKSIVLVLDASDDILKFLKMHLNRYFSHVAVNKSGTDAYRILKEQPIDMIIAEGASPRKSISDFLKKLSAKHRQIPVVMTRNADGPPFTAGDFPALFVSEVVEKPFDMDGLHISIRRAMNIRSPLKELASLMDPSVAIGKVIRTAQLVDLTDRRQALVAEIRKCLTEEITE
jgi:DNA-binding NtrC family response regulator